MMTTTTAGGGSDREGDALTADSGSNRAPSPGDAVESGALTR